MEAWLKSSKSSRLERAVQNLKQELHKLHLPPNLANLCKGDTTTDSSPNKVISPSIDSPQADHSTVWYTLYIYTQRARELLAVYVGVWSGLASKMRGIVRWIGGKLCLCFRCVSEFRCICVCACAATAILLNVLRVREQLALLLSLAFS